MQINRDTLPYRRGVVGLVTDKTNMILLVQLTSYKDDQWRFPGGGIENGETDETALLRELKEELNSDSFEVIQKSKHTNKYDWADEVIERQFVKQGVMWRGQQQSQFLVKFTGKHSGIKPNPEEIKNIKWVTLNTLKGYMIFPNQWDQVKIVVEELLNYH